MDIGLLFSIVIGSIFINNFIFSRFLGLCPFMGISDKMESSFGMGFAVTFVMTLASGVTWLIYKLLLVPFHIEYLRTLAFILVIAALVQMVEVVVQKVSPGLYGALGIFLPLITTNCAVLGVALLNINAGYGFIESTVNGFASAVGFTLALVILAGIRERISYSDIPQNLKGPAITFIIAGLLAMAFMGFNGMKI